MTIRIERARKEVISMYDGLWLKSKLYSLYYPNDNKNQHLRKWIKAVFKEIGETETNADNFYLFFREELLRSKENGSGGINNPYPYTLFLFTVRNFVKDPEKLYRLEMGLIMRTSRLVQELQIYHLQL